MNRFTVFVLLCLALNTLEAKESIFISPKVTLTMIDKDNIQFISIGKSALSIKNSKSVNPKFLESTDILGRSSCSPFYLCPKNLETYFSGLGIDSTKPLIIYDESYGIHAATLYLALESIGHENVSILRGNLHDISKLDPNWEVYSKYLEEFHEYSSLANRDTNESILENYTEKIESLKAKIDVLKPHLLLQENLQENDKHRSSHYRVQKINKKYLLSKSELEKTAEEIRTDKSNVTLINACEMIDIVGNRSSTTELGVKFLSWRTLIDKDKKYLKDEATLDELFTDMGLSKSAEHYVYCMSGAAKAFFVMMALREVGYTSVKAFTGDWNVWVGEVNE